MVKNFYADHEIGRDGTFGFESKGFQLIDIKVRFLANTEDI